MNQFDLIAILPEAILTITGICLMMLGAFRREGAARRCSTHSLLGLLAAAAAVAYGRRFPGLAYGGMFSVDPFGRYFRLLFYVIAALVALASVDYLRRERLAAGEYYALLLFATVGMGLM